MARRRRYRLVVRIIHCIVLLYCIARRRLLLYCCVYFHFVRNLTTHRRWPIAFMGVLLLSLCTRFDNHTLFACILICRGIPTAKSDTGRILHFPVAVYQNVVVTFSPAVWSSIFPSTMADCLSGYILDHTARHDIRVLSWRMICLPLLFLRFVHFVQPVRRPL